MEVDCQLNNVNRTLYTKRRRIRVAQSGNVILERSIQSLYVPHTFSLRQLQEMKWNTIDSKVWEVEKAHGTENYRSI